MRKSAKLIVTAICAIASFAQANAQSKPFIDTSRPKSVLTFGVRAGLNSSSLSNNYLSVQPEMIQSNFYWRMGSQIGGVVDLHIRNFFAVTTGIFLENHSFDCSLMAANSNDDYMGSRFLHSRFNYLHFPVMASFRINVLPHLVWQIDLGTYFAYGIFGKKTSQSYIAFGAPDSELIFDQEFEKVNFFEADNKDFLAVGRKDFGLKAGTGLTLFEKYVITVHYQKGLKNIAKQNEGSASYKLRNCMWSVSLGYNF